ncbi:response regulator [Desulfonatronum sp. SC1]|uniref:response regulator n=1 Tax=Desulfonatronum sp. SC1 TaxID=2109626 RepID=UPI001304EA5F|nr:response regulator [Desulfonatronum sp. SC1]
MAKILVVDDASIIRNMMELLLKDGGHEVLAEAGSGQEAFELYKKHQPDLVTMDINMSMGESEQKRGGILTLKKILSEFPQAKAIMVSSHANKEILLESIKPGPSTTCSSPRRYPKCSIRFEKLTACGRGMLKKPGSRPKAKFMLRTIFERTLAETGGPKSGPAAKSGCVQPRV